MTLSWVSFLLPILFGSVPATSQPAPAQKRVAPSSRPHSKENKTNTRPAYRATSRPVTQATSQASAKPSTPALVTAHQVEGWPKRCVEQIPPRNRHGFHGNHWSCYPGGKWRSAWSWKNGRKEGAFYAWHKNGVLWWKGTYQRNQMVGLFLGWHANRKPAFRHRFLRGKPHGKSKIWYPNGVLAGERSWKYGVLCGEIKAWSQEGKPKSLPTSDWYVKRSRCKVTPTGASCPPCHSVRRPKNPFFQLIRRTQGAK